MTIKQRIGLVLLIISTGLFGFGLGDLFGIYGAQKDIRELLASDEFKKEVLKQLDAASGLTAMKGEN